MLDKLSIEQNGETYIKDEFSEQKILEHIDKTISG